MKKLKERLKRGLALMMAAASIVSVLPSMNVSAASQTAKITFAYCHDGAGNAIRYQQTVTHDGRVCGEAGRQEPVSMRTGSLPSVSSRACRCTPGTHCRQMRPKHGTP